MGAGIGRLSGLLDRASVDRELTWRSAPKSLDVPRYSVHGARHSDSVLHSDDSSVPARCLAVRASMSFSGLISLPSGLNRPVPIRKRQRFCGRRSDVISNQNATGREP
jgi:hypothetical protein